MASLFIDGVSAGYGQRNVLQEISMRIEGGEIVALVGPNGVGKSTLLRALTGVAPVRSGEIRYGETNLVTAAPAKRAQIIAIVPQSPRLPPAYTVAEIVAMGRTPYLPWFGRESAEDFRVVEEVCTRTGLHELLRRRADELSGGERQRVSIARALAQRPKVLCLDEATSNLDWKYQIKTLELVRELAREDSLVVLAAIHDLNLASRFAHRIAVLHQGRLFDLDQPGKVLTAANIQEVFEVEVLIENDPVSGRPFLIPGQLRPH